MALGIGGSTAIFSVVNAVLLRDMPYPEASRIFVVRAIAPDGQPGNVSRRELAPFYEDQHPLVEKAALVWSLDAQIVEADQRPSATVQYGVSDDSFDVLGTRMHLGRGFERDDRADAYLAALDRLAPAEEPLVQGAKRKPAGMTDDWNRRHALDRRARNLRAWHGLLLEWLEVHDAARRPDRIASHPALGGPEMDFMKARIARLRRDDVRAPS